MTTAADLEQAALAIAAALKPQVEAAVAVLVTAKADMDAVIAASPNVGSSRAMMVQASQVFRNYAHTIAQPLIDLGLEIDLTALDPPAPEPTSPPDGV